MTVLLRAVLAVALLAGLYLLALVLVLAPLALVAAGIVGLTSGPSTGWSVPTYLQYLLLLVAALALDWAILRGVFASRPADSGTRIPVPEDSELWPLVTGLARRIGTAPPRHLYLYTDANAEVRENARWLGLLGWTRSMDIGLPLLAALSPDQLQAVLCHELGHYNHSDTRLISLTYRGHITIRATLARLLEISEVRRPLLLQLLTTASARLFGRYARLYLGISTAVARRQELHADAQAAQAVQDTLQQRQHLTDAEARAAAAQVTAQALLLVHAVPEAWADFLNCCPTLMHGYPPSRLFIAFQDMVTSSGYQQDLAGFQQSALDRHAERFDTHPSLSERLRHLDVDATGCISHGAQNPLLGNLQPYLDLIARGIHRTATRSAATVEIPGTGTPERAGGVVRIDPHDRHSGLWRAISVIAPILVVLTIIGVVASALKATPITPSPDNSVNPGYSCLVYGQWNPGCPNYGQLTDVPSISIPSPIPLATVPLASPVPVPLPAPFSLPSPDRFADRVDETAFPHVALAGPARRGLSAGGSPYGRLRLEGAMLAATMAAWLHQLTAGEDILAGHGMRGGKAMIATLRRRLIAVPGRLTLQPPPAAACSRVESRPACRANP